MNAPAINAPSMAIAQHLTLNATKEVARIAARLRQQLSRALNRRGLVVAISGGVDSAVCAHLAVRAVGAGRVFGLLLPERDSQDESTRRGRQVAEQLGIDHALFDIAPALEALGCYRQRDEAMRATFPAYTDGWKSKLVIAGGQDGHFNHFKLVVQAPDGAVEDARLEHRDYLQIVAATNFKQRIRKNVEYFHADRLHYAVVGTPNRLEYDQGFFVKNGDGAADLKPIAHLYKTQVYQLAEHLGVSADIRTAAPSTDTYSMAQGQDEFYFALPWPQMDIALFGVNHGLPVEAIAAELGIAPEQARRICADIAAKRRTTAPLHWPPLLIEPVSGPRTIPPVA
ncbi:NAD(+) synthase [Rhodocyclaceae bacterium]